MTKSPNASTVVYKTVNRHEIYADVYTPMDGGTGAAILSIHGGGLIAGSRLEINPDLLHKYLAAGFAVVSIDYRLAPETKLTEIVTDAEDAYAWMRQEGSVRFGFDADQISVMGVSGGGYLTLVAGYRFSPRPRALVSFYGYGAICGTWYSQPSDFYLQGESISQEQARSAVGTATISNGPASRLTFYLYCRQQGSWLQEICGHDPSDRDWFADYEPLRNVSPDYPPTLLLHGEADWDVPFEQSVLMAKELAHHDVVHELISDPSWGHLFDLEEPSDPKLKQAIDRAVEFLVEHGK